MYRAVLRLVGAIVIPNRNQSPLVTDLLGACPLDQLPDMIPENELGQIPQTPNNYPRAQPALLSFRFMIRI